MDVQMPELDGFQTTIELRKLEAETGSHIPVVALTAHAMKGDREKCLEAGMDAYLSKPLRARDLIALVEKLCQSVTAARIGTFSNGTMAATDSPSQGRASSDEGLLETQSEPQTPGVDFTGAIDRMDGDVELLTEQMRFFLDDAPQLVDQMIEAIASNNGPQLQSAAHRLKGLVSSYDQKAAADLCLTLEFAGRDTAFYTTRESVDRLRPLISNLASAIREFVAEHAV
jgi:two-component system, sensor histidine kinase and response regulator